MRNVCLVTNYNYAQYIAECLFSLASQTRKFDLIIIVDDGSTDESRTIIGNFVSNCNYALLINKENGGQLSCFHTALELIEPDDYVFCMDSDDIFPRDYLEQVSIFIDREKNDFIFVNSIQFAEEQQPLKSACIAPEEFFSFSTSSALTRKTCCWIGAETSCISMKGSLFHDLLPYPYEKDWITRADDLLIYGASIIGAHKLYIASLGINYRIHTSNNFAGKKYLASDRADWRLRHERLFAWYSSKAGVPVNSSLKNAIHEAIIIPKPIRRHFGIPSPAVLFLHHLEIIVSMVRILLIDMVDRKPQ